MTTLDINQKYSLKGTGISNTEHTAFLRRHRWYSIKEGFSPNLVDIAISESGCRRSDIIIDPFSGSGTVPLRATLKGNPSVGFEVNPFLAFVSKTKLHHCNLATFKKHLPLIEAGINRGMVSKLETFSTFSEAGNKKKWLFNTPVIRAFAGGWYKTIPMRSPHKDLYQLALIGAAMDTCNAVKDGKCLRYIKDWQTIKNNKQMFLASFHKRIGAMAHDLKDNITWGRKGNTRIYTGDVRQLINKKLPGQFKVCITSPPYLNSFDYTDIYRPELFLGNFIESQEDLMRLRLKTLRSHVQAKWSPPIDKELGSIFPEILNQVKDKSEELWDNRIPQMIHAYFEDIKHLLNSLKKHSQKTSSVWIVVSTSAYAGVEIPVDLIIADIGEKVGWSLREIGVLRHLRSSSQHRTRLRESVIILSSS